MGVKKQFTKEYKIRILKELETKKLGEVCREHDLAPSTVNGRRTDYEKNPILLIDKNNYFKELLNREGIFTDTSNDIPITIQSYKILILCNPILESFEIKKIERYIEDGGKLIIINPDKSLSTYFGLREISRDAKTKIKINRFWCNAYNPVFYQIDENYKKTEKKGLFFSLNYKNTQVVIVAFDFLKTIFLLTHGIEIKRDVSGVTRSGSKIVIEENHDLYPQADILLRYLISIIEEYVCIPRVWYLPHKKLAGLIITHDTDNVGNNSLLETHKLNQEKNIKTTTFILLKTGTPNCWRRLANFGADIQLHQAYIYFSFGYICYTLNILFTNRYTNFLHRNLLFLERYCLERILKKRILGIRNHGLFWYKNDTIIKWLKDGNLYFDSSLGSSVRYGYLFGTGLPYYLRFSNYVSSGVLEFPLHIMDHIAYVMGYEHRKSQNYSLLFKKIKKLVHDFIDNAIRFNSILTFDFHQKYLAHKEIREWYLDIIKYAKKKDILINNMSYFNEFWRKRSQIQIEYLSIEENLIKYKLTSNYRIEGLTQILPIRFKGNRLKKIIVNNKKIVDWNEHLINKKGYALFEYDINNSEIFEVYYD